MKSPSLGSNCNPGNDVRVIADEEAVADLLFLRLATSYIRASRSIEAAASSRELPVHVPGYLCSPCIAAARASVEYAS